MTTLPIADFAQVRDYARRLMRRHRGTLAAMLVLYALAAMAALIPAYVIGLFTNDAVANALTSAKTVRLTEVLALSSLAYGVLSFFARRLSYILGEQVFAELREEFLASVLKLPLSVVEQAGTGDLLSRTTSDVEAMSRMVRFAVPEWLVALVQTLLTAAAMILVSPTAAIASVVSLPPIFFATRYYLRYATPGYRRERMSYATLAGTVSETAEGARTVDALQLGQRQLQRIEGNLRENFYAEMYTLLMRMIWFPIVESSFALAVAGTLGWSGLLALHHVITIGAATTVTLYVVQINDPLDRIVAWLDELQLGQSSLARLVGVAMVEDTRPVTGPTPAGEELVVTNVSYAYRSGHNVLHAVSLTIRPGERLAIVGPSGAGKSTLGRLLADGVAFELVLPTMPHLHEMIEAGVKDWPVQPRIVIGEDAKRAAFRSARAAFAKSGTVTLELALAQVPMVAAYKAGTVEAWIIRRAIRASSVILANLVVGENVVPEFIQEDCIPDKLAPALRDVLADSPMRRRQVEAFARIDAIMATGDQSPSARAADVVLTLLRRAAPQG